MKIMMKPIVDDTIDAVTKGLLQRLKDLEIKGQKETTETNALLRLVRLLRRVLETWGDLLSFWFQWKTIS